MKRIIVALVALLAYLYVTKKDEVVALWRNLVDRFGRRDDDDE